MRVSRRQLLQSGAAAVPALVLPVRLSARAAGGVQLNAWLKIASDETVTVLMSQCEMGQDVYTTMPMLVAEELEADWSKIRVELASSSLDPAFVNPFLAAQVTAGSFSVVGFEGPLRKAGAQAREMLRAAAARRWSLPVQECRAEHGRVVHARTGRRLSYGALAEDASKLPVPANVTLKSPKDWKILGKPTHRLDGRAKGNGTAIYGIDVKVPGMLTGTVRACPVSGGKLKALDETPALAVRGVHSVVKLESAFMVLADSYWAAHRGADALHPVWAPGPFGNFSSEQLNAQLKAKLSEPGISAVRKGDAAKAIAAAARKIEAVYEVPYLAHATMEPMNGTVSVKPDGIEAWLPTQAPGWHQMALAKTFALKPEQVVIHSTFLGGGFGRRGEIDFALYPALASKASGRPVKIIWPREEDMQHDFYRPMAVGQLRAALDAQGVPTALDLKLVAQSISARLSGAAGDAAQGSPGGPSADPFAVFGLSELEYGLGDWQVTYVEQKEGAPVGTWRAVPNTFNGFFIESFIDEIAHQGGQDPAELRRTLLAHSPRALAVLEKAISASGWGKAPSGRFQGIAMFKEAGTVICEVAEISLEKGNRLTMHKITAVVDCGQALNPRGVEQQIQGGVLDGLSAALYGEITLEGGRVSQSNFDTYPLLRLAEAPQVEVHIIDSGAPLGGVGEPAVGPIAPAIANAIFAASGQRIRRLPVVKNGYSIGA